MNHQSPTLEILLAAVLEYAAAGERRAFLDDACGDNPALREELESLLAASEDAGDFMTARAVTAALPLPAETAGAPIRISRVPAPARTRRPVPAGARRKQWHSNRLIGEQQTPLFPSVSPP